MVKQTIDQTPPGLIKATARFIFADAPNTRFNDSINHLMFQAMHTGIIEGMNGTINADPTKFDISAGTGIFIDKISPQDPIIEILEFPETLAIPNTVLFNPTSHIYVDKLGVVTTEINPPTRDDLKNRLHVSGVGHGGGFIFRIFGEPIVAYGSTITELEELVFTGGSTLQEGIVAPGGTDLSIDAFQSILRQYGRNFLVDPTSPNVETTVDLLPVPVGQFLKLFINATGGLDIDGSDNQLDPTKINLDGLGTLTTISPAGNYSIIRVFQSAIDNNLLFYYGTKQYSTLNDALTSVEMTFTEHAATRNISPRAIIYLPANTTDLASAVASGTAIIKIIMNRSQLP